MGGNSTDTRNAGGANPSVGDREAARVAAKRKYQRVSGIRISGAGGNVDRTRRTKLRDMFLCYFRRRYERGEQQGCLLLVRFGLGPELQLLLKPGNADRFLIGRRNDRNVVIWIFMRGNDVLVFDPWSLKSHRRFVLEEKRQRLTRVKRDEPPGR